MVINLFEPNLGKNSLEELEQVFKSNWLGRGKKVKEFEELFAGFTQIEKNLLATNSCCSDAIFNAIKVLDLEEKDVVVIPTNSFPAIGSAILESKANLKIVDINSHGNIDLDKIPQEILKSAKLFFITHYGGIPADIERLKIESNNSLIFEDCACSLGTKVNNISLGSNSDFACWSLDPMKLITCGEGGVFHSKNKEFLNDLRKYNYLGLPIKEKSGLEKSDADSQWWIYNIENTGRRSVFCDFHAAMGIPEIKKISFYLNQKKKFRAIYEDFFNRKGIGFVPQDSKETEYSNYFMTIQISNRDKLALFLKNNGIYSSLRYSPLHKMPLFSQFSVGDMKGADDFYAKSLNLPIHQKLNEEKILFICEKINEFFENIDS